MSSTPRADGPIRWVRTQSSVCGTHTMTSPAAGGNTAVILRGQGLRCLEAAHVTCPDTTFLGISRHHQEHHQGAEQRHRQYAVGNE
jgi:hypothetical protein